MNKKITLGLLVFFLGVALTACGSKKASSPAAVPANNNNGNNGNNGGGFVDGGSTIPDTDCNGQSSCTIDMGGSYLIMDGAAYNNEFGYNNQQQASLPTWQNGQLQWGSFKDNLINCGIKFGWAYLWTELTGNDADAGCTFQQNSSNTQFADLTNTSYPVNYGYNFIQGGQQVHSIQLFIENRNEQNNMNGELMTCWPNGSQFYQCSHPRSGNQMGLRDMGNGVLQLETTGGQPFGTFRVTHRQ